MRIVARVFLVSGLALALCGTADADGDHKASVAKLKGEATPHAASHFSGAGGDNVNAGAIASARGKIKHIGKATVEVSSSWDWGSYRQAEVNTGGVDLEVHPCALVNTTSHSFSAANDLGTVGGGFTAAATVQIVAKKGTLSGKIVGGSVCEIAWVYNGKCSAGGGPCNEDGDCSGPDTCDVLEGPVSVSPGAGLPTVLLGTINEGLTSFEITGGTGKFEGRSGSGIIHSVFNFATVEFEVNEIIVRVGKEKEHDDDD